MGPGANVSSFHPSLIKMSVRPRALIRRGMAEASAQRFVDAVNSFGEALKMDERNTTVLVLRGRAHCCLRNWDSAEGDFSKSLKIDPGCVDASAGLEIVCTPHLPLPLTDA